MGSILTLPSRGAPERQPSAGLDILVRNTASVSADVWFRGSGPLARVPAHGETTVRVLGPGALTVTSRADETAGVIVTLVESSLGALQSGALRCALPPGGRAPADTPRGGARALLLSVPPLRVLVRVFARIVGAQRALRARRTAALNAARVRRAAAATTMQRYARRLLARVLRPCEICLEDVPRGVLVRIGECEVHRACMRCVHTYVALQLLDGRLHVRCPGVACSCVVEAHTLVEYVTREAFKLCALRARAPQWRVARRAARRRAGSNFSRSARRRTRPALRSIAQLTYALTDHAPLLLPAGAAQVRGAIVRCAYGPADGRGRRGLPRLLPGARAALSDVRRAHLAQLGLCEHALRVRRDVQLGLERGARQA